MLRFFLFLTVVLCPLLGPLPAFADVPAATTASSSSPAPSPASGPKLVIGEDVMHFGETAGSTAKTAMYFFAALIAGFGIWKHFQQKQAAAPSAMKIIGRTSVGPRAALILAQVEGRRFLLSQTPDRLSLISELGPQNSDFQTILSEELDTQHPRKDQANEH